MYSGKKLKQLRQSLELTQEEFSEKLGVSQSYYSAIEVSKRKMTKKMRDKIFTIWNIEPGYFDEKEVDKKEVNKNKILRGKNEGLNEGSYSLDETSEIIKKTYLTDANINEEFPDYIELQYFIDTFGITIQQLTEEWNESEISQVSKLKIFDKSNRTKNGKFLPFDELQKSYYSKKIELLRKLVDYKEDIDIAMQSIKKVRSMLQKIEFGLSANAHIVVVKNKK